MKKINIFPKTVIQTNGTHPYVLKTVARDNSLKLIEIESKDDSAINVDLSDIVFDGVAIKAYSELGETTLRWVRQCRSTQNFVNVQNRPLECDDDLKVEYLSELEFLVSKGYTFSPSNLKFVPLFWTDVTYEWTLPAGLNNLSTLPNMGYYMWTDNEGNYYYGRASSYPVYKIDFENKSITEMTGWTRRSGSLFWRIGDTVLYDTTTVWRPNNTTSPVTWMGEFPPSVAYIWTDGEHIYWTDPNGTSGVLTSFDYDPNMGYYGSWDSVTFTYTPSNFDPKYVWTDGERVYYSRGPSYQYVLDKANRDWQISVIVFQGYSISDPTLQLFTDGVDIYMNSSSSAGSTNRLLKYNKDMWTFEVVSHIFEWKGPSNMISKFMICPSCRYKGLPSAIGNINPNTDDIYNRVAPTMVLAMDKIEAD